MNDRLKNREILKSYFQKGLVPTEEQFAALIDSMHNIKEDGNVNATDKNGLILYPTGKGRILASLFDKKPDASDDRPLWRISLADDGSLVIGSEQGVTVLDIGTDGGMTMPDERKKDGDDDKEEKGVLPDSKHMILVKADSCWHDLPVEAAAERPREGCRVYRISACLHDPHAGKYALCEADASHANGLCRKVSSKKKHWWGWAGRIKIRWQFKDQKLYLQMRSCGNLYGEESIFCRIETLWDI